MQFVCKKVSPFTFNAASQLFSFLSFLPFFFFFFFFLKQSWWSLLLLPACENSYHLDCTASVFACCYTVPIGHHIPCGLDPFKYKQNNEHIKQAPALFHPPCSLYGYLSTLSNVTVSSILKLQKEKRTYNYLCMFPRCLRGMYQGLKLLEVV